MKEYFSHDYNARHDRKITALVKDYKSSGYGIFWATCELMHEEGDRLDYDEITFGAIAKDLNEPEEFIKEVIDKCISKFRLFTKQETKLTSSRVKQNLSGREAKRSKKQAAGRLGGIKSGESRRSKQNEATLEANELNKSKGKESKEEESKVKERLYLNPLHEIYVKSWDEYSKILNGQLKDFSEQKFILWKDFVDFICKNNFTDLFSAKFVSPIDFDKLVLKGFTKDKWDIVLRKILSTGVKPEHNLFFRIPDFMGYALKGNMPNNEDSEYEKKIKMDREKYRSKGGNQ